MAEITNITVGQELPKETWEAAAERISKAAPLLAAWFKQQNFEGKGEQDAQDFMNDMLLATMALSAVAMNPGVCRFIAIPGKKGGDYK
jgi:hypothetical protein